MLLVRRYVCRSPGNDDATRLRHPLLVRLPAGRSLRPAQQLGRDPQRRIQADLRVPATVRPARSQHRHVAGKILFFFWIWRLDGDCVVLLTRPAWSTCA